MTWHVGLEAFRPITGVPRETTANRVLTLALVYGGFVQFWASRRVSLAHTYAALTRRTCKGLRGIAPSRLPWVGGRSCRAMWCIAHGTGIGKTNDPYGFLCQAFAAPSSCQQTKTTNNQGRSIVIRALPRLCASNTSQGAHVPFQVVTFSSSSASTGGAAFDAFPFLGHVCMPVLSSQLIPSSWLSAVGCTVTASCMEPAACAPHGTMRDRVNCRT